MFNLKCIYLSLLNCLLPDANEDSPQCFFFFFFFFSLRFNDVVITSLVRDSICDVAVFPSETTDPNDALTTGLNRNE